MTAQVGRTYDRIVPVAPSFDKVLASGAVPHMNVLRRRISSKPKRSGFGQQYLSDLERGKRNPTIVSLYELAQALGVSHVDLVRPPRRKSIKSRRQASK